MIAETPPSVPVHLRLTVSAPPSLNITSHLWGTAISDIDADGMTIEIFLPEGLARTAGDLSWAGHMIAGHEQVLSVTIKAIALGNWTVRARAGYLVVGGWYGDIAEMTISVKTNAGFLAQTAQRVTSERAVPVSPSQLPLGPSYRFGGNNTPNLPASFLPATGPGNLLVTGTFYTYISEDAISAPGTMRADQLQPMVWGAIEIYDGNGNYLGGEPTGPDADDSEGRFQISINNPGLTGFYVATVPWTNAADVLQSDGITQYRATTSLFTTSQSTFDIESWTTPDNANYRAAWRTYETIVNDHYGRGAWNFLVNRAGLSSATLGMATVEVPSPDGGTYFHEDPSTYIHVESPTYTMALDTVQHEYAHYTMYKVYGSFPSTDCPSPHYINGVSGIRCGWTEGWADFFPLMVQSEARRSLGESPDAVYEWGNGSEISLEVPTWGTPGWNNGPQVEGRVAGALNDIYDWTNDAMDSNGGYDIFTDYYTDIWDTFSHSYDYTFEDFWNAWKSRGHDQSNGGTVACLFHNTIEYTPVFISATTTITGTSTASSTSYLYQTTTTTITSYTSTSTSTSTIPTVTTVVLVPLTITSTEQSTQFLTSVLTTTVTDYTSTTTLTSTIPTTVALVPLTMTSTAQSTQLLTSILTTTVTSYTGTETSTSTIPTLTTVVLVPSSVTSTVQSTQYLTSILTTTVTNYTSTWTSTSTIPTVTTVVLLLSTVTSTTQGTQYLTSILTTTVTNYTSTTTSTSTSVVYTTVTASPGGAGPAGAGASSSMAYPAFITVLAIMIGHRVTAGRPKRVPKVRAVSSSIQSYSSSRGTLSLNEK
jgi:hypothetical protein